MSQRPGISPRANEEYLLSHAVWLVPRGAREEWLRFWAAELWHARRVANRPAQQGASLYAGVLRDALWLRTASWKRALHGTATLCLLVLCLGCCLAALLALALCGGMRGVACHLSLEYVRFLFAAPLVIVATFLTSTRRTADVDHAPRVFLVARAALFLFTKGALQFMLAYFVSTDLCLPLAASFPNTAGFFQILLFVLIFVCGLRWTFQDQEVRCKQCLRLLGEPARVGRRSRNLLEWNGTELRCKDGHGALTIPELETSWHQSSQWSRQIRQES